MATDRIVRFGIDAAQRSWRIDGDKPHGLPVGADIAQAPDVIRFAPDGSASGGRIEIGAGTMRRDVDVGWLTGRVSIADAR
jgi:hypothetical protein